MFPLPGENRLLTAEQQAPKPPFPTISKRNFSYQKNAFSKIGNQVSIPDIWDMLVIENQHLTGLIQQVQAEILSRGEDCPLGDVPGDLYQANQSDFKSLKDFKLYLKRKLPGVVPSLEIKPGESRSDGGKHTGIFVLDFDHLPDVEQALEQLAKNPFTVLAFVSPSGDGLKAFVYVEACRLTDHAGIFTQIAAVYEQEHGLTVDRSGIDATRLCFLPFDPEARFNRAALPFPVDRQGLEAQKAEAGAIPEIGHMGSRSDRLIIEAAEAQARRGMPGRHGGQFLEQDQAWNHLIWLCIGLNNYGLTREKAATYLESHYQHERTEEALATAYRRADLHGKGRKYLRLPVEPPKPKRVSDYKAEILAAIEQHDRLVLDPRTGSGKTFAFLANTDEYKAIGQELAARYQSQVIFVVPTRFLAKQTSDVYDIPCVDGTTHWTDLEHAKASAVCIVTMDSLWKIISEPEQAVLIFDEAHELVNAEYRSKVCKQAFDYARQARKSIFLSATPTAYLDKIGFHYHHIEIPETNQVELLPVIYSGDPAEVVFSYLEQLDFSSGRYVLYMNDKEKAKILSRLLTQAGKIPADRRVAIINSDDKENPDYLHLCTEQALAPDVCLAVVTKLIEAGVNINNEDIQAWFHVDSPGPGIYPDPAEMVQALARPRKMARLKVYAFSQEREGAQKLADPEAFLYNLFELAEADLAGIQAAAKLAQGAPMESDRFLLRRRYEEAQFYRINHLTKKEEVDTLTIYQAFRHEVVYSLSTEAFFRELAGLCPHYQILPWQRAEQYVNEGFREMEKEERQARELADMRLNTLVIEKTELVLEAAFHLSNDQSLKQELKSRAGMFQEMSNPAAELVAEHAEVFQYTTWKAVFRWMELEKRGFKDADIAGIFGSLSNTYKARTERRLNRWQQSAEQALAHSNRQVEKLEALLEREGPEEKRAARLVNHQDNIRKIRGKLAGYQVEQRRIQTEEIIFSGEDYAKFSSTFETLAMIERARKKPQSLTRRETYQVERLKAFGEEIRKRQGRALSIEQVRKLYAKACNHQPDLVAGKQALARLEELFFLTKERKKKGLFFIPGKRRKYGDFVRTTIRKAEQNSEAQKRPLQAVNGDFGSPSQPAEKVELPPSMINTDIIVFVYPPEEAPF